METIYSHRKMVLPCPHFEGQKLPKLLGTTGAQVSHLHGL